jgi:hypothetical protein|tara:strand:- start:4539 stop:4796 length:258 start_codon:yes stop_codon:yes gene_type:complete
MLLEGAIVLLMFFGSPLELKEYTVRDGLSECLKAKRTIERNVKSPTQKEYSGTMRLACKKLDVEVNERNSIIKFVDVEPSELKPF